MSRFATRSRLSIAVSLIAFATAAPLHAGGGQCGPCAGDADGSCNVDEVDLGLVLGSWQLAVPPFTLGDVDGDGLVNESDLGIVLANWQRVCPQNNPPTSIPGGPYSAECQGANTVVALDGRGSSDPNGDALTFQWLSQCEDATFDDNTSATPNITIPMIGCTRVCQLELGVNDGVFPTVFAPVTVTVRDTTPPQLTLPADVTLECGSSADPASAGRATATDACGGVPTITFTDAPVGDARGSIDRTWQATDACGNVANAVQRITFQDTTPPALTIPPNATVECGGSTAPAATGTASATDTCGAATVSFSDAPLAGVAGSVTRTWIATDAAGNTSSGAQTITVVDTLPPTVQCPPNAQVQADATTGVPANLVVLAAPVVTDACGGAAPTVTDDRPATFPVGSTTVTFTIRDAAGNAVNCTMTVVVLPPADAGQQPPPVPQPEPTQPARIYQEDRVTTTISSGLCITASLTLLLTSLVGAARSGRRRG